VSTSHDEVLDAGLEERLALVSQPDYEGAPMVRSDYMALFAVTAVLPIILLIVSWVML
jgi:hypothetical protein